MKTKIAIGSDHAGYQLKEVLKKDLEQKGIEVTLAARNEGYPLEVRIEEDK